MNLKSTLGEFLDKAIDSQNTGGILNMPAVEIFRLLLSCGCDYYELLHPFSRLKYFSQNELLTFISFAPTSQTLPDLNLTTIHSMIPRWTATKYHTAPKLEMQDFYVLERVIANLRHSAQ